MSRTTDRRSKRHEPSPLAVEDYLLLSAVVVLPWAFGGVEIWAYRVAALLLVALLSGTGVVAAQSIDLAFHHGAHDLYSGR